VRANAVAVGDPAIGLVPAAGRGRSEGVTRPRAPAPTSAAPSTAAASARGRTVTVRTQARDALKMRLTKVGASPVIAAPRAPPSTRCLPRDAPR
jgi:hypothetical protein